MTISKAGASTKREFMVNSLCLAIASNPERHRYLAGKIAMGALDPRDAAAKNNHKARIMVDQFLGAAEKMPVLDAQIDVAFKAYCALLADPERYLYISAQLNAGYMSHEEATNANIIKSFEAI
jgi:hypothetical protein